MTITIKSFFEPAQLKKDLQINDTDINTCMMEQPGLFHHYATLAARAQKQVDDFKMLQEVTESKVGKSMRDAAAAAGMKITESQISKDIALHEKVIEITRAFNEAKMIAEILKATIEAFKEKRDMLVQIGVSLREDKKGEVAVRTRANMADAIASKAAMAAADAAAEQVAA